MKKHTLVALILFLSAGITTRHAVGQTATQKTTRRVTSQGEVTRATKIYEKETGRLIPYEEFSSMLESGSKEYAVIPIIDEHGKADAYMVRKRTKKELEGGQSSILNEYKKPKPGEALSPFVMKGSDRQTYSSAALRGSYVLLSFWPALAAPAFGDARTRDLRTLLDVAKKNRVKLVSLGITKSSEAECRQATKDFALGFVPVPDSRNFMIKYGLGMTPSYLLLGPDGTLLGLVEKDSPLTLQKHLEK